MEDIKECFCYAQQSASNIKKMYNEAQAILENAKIEAEKIKQKAKQDIIDLGNKGFWKNRQHIFEN